MDGDGTIRRCHFVPEVIGNLYDGALEKVLAARECPKALCDCHIGYVHLESLPLYDAFAGGVLERIPASLEHSHFGAGVDLIPIQVAR
ncbi:MAG: hypothetical protein U5O16_11245 [Rhodococcus sp. (in: high G+C Gram-positive bacteria)]|uniref:hypothetical protein n=1 Tax=Rhodococcus sp. TaxID=1831 RepID=UPI002AD6E41A|nr:hypothetical protein [Rhodococcus sp. (in: high G+C Gram-positive bacteria)]